LDITRLIVVQIAVQAISSEIFSIVLQITTAVAAPVILLLTPAAEVRAAVQAVQVHQVAVVALRL
jgi:hypothetical protein